MADDQPKEITDIEIHPPAEQLIKKYSDDFAESLIYQSKVLAKVRKADLVLTKHVEDAHELIRREGGRRNRTREFLVFLGSAMFGAFFPGFISALEDNNNALIIIYVIVGFVGITMFLWQQRRI